LFLSAHLFDMKLRKTLAAAAGGVGLAALGNYVLRRRAHDLPQPLGRPLATYRWRGFDVAYTEAGDPDDPDMLLLHGVNAAASSHEFREIVDALAEEYHVIAPDLPGFGHSDRPPLLYSAALYTTFVEEAIEDLADDPIVVASSLTGAYAAKAAESVDVDSLVLVCPTDESIPGRRTWLRSLFRAPVVGEGLFNLLVSERGLRYFHDDHGYFDMVNLTDETVEFEWLTAHQSGARYAPASFVGGFLDPEFDLLDVLSGLDVPVTVIWGREADLPPMPEGRELAERADARFEVVDQSALLPHVEGPEQFLDYVQAAVSEA
jgi:pimeloyl-ACP methyl ester carboxylesterase